MILTIKSKTHGIFNIILDDNVDKIILNRTWSVNKKKCGIYFVTTVGKRKQDYLHRMLLNCPKGTFVDHINGNTFDNRLSNLRICTRTENLRNKKQISAVNTSGYKGVRFVSKTKKWEAVIVVSQKHKYIGRYKTLKEAVLAYNNAALKYFGQFARLNVLESKNEE